MSHTMTDDDIETEALCASVSRATYKLLTIEAKRLGISRADFIELAIQTSLPESPAWQQQWQKISINNHARKSITRLKRSLSWQHKMRPEDRESHKKDILVDLAKTGCDEKYLAEQLTKVGLTLLA